MQSNGSNSQARRADNDARLQESIAQAKTGSNSALGRALNLCRPRLLQSARKSLGRRFRSQAGASDVVQDTFVNATKGFGNFRGQYVGEFVSWLCTILSCRLAEIARRTGRASGDPRHEWGNDFVEPLPRHLVADGSSPSSIAGHQEYAELIRTGLARMSQRDQQVLGLRFEDGLTYLQIGERLGLSEDAARMLFTRAVKRLKRDPSLQSLG